MPTAAPAVQEAAYAIERLMDTIAGELDLDPAEVRRRNFPARFFAAYARRPPL